MQESKPGLWRCFVKWLRREPLVYVVKVHEQQGPRIPSDAPPPVGDTPDAIIDYFADEARTLCELAEQFGMGLIVLGYYKDPITHKSIRTTRSGGLSDIEFVGLLTAVTNDFAYSDMESE